MSTLVRSIENFIGQRYFKAARKLVDYLPEPQKTEWMKKIDEAERAAETLEDAKTEWLNKIKGDGARRAAWLKRHNKPCKKTLL